MIVAIFPKIFFLEDYAFIYSLQIYHVIGVRLSSQSASEKHNQEKSPQTFAHLANFSKNVSAMFNNHTIVLFWLQNKETFLRVVLRAVILTYYARKGS